MQSIIFSYSEPSITRLFGLVREEEKENVLTLSCYHLIEEGNEENKTYQVGFCRLLEYGKREYAIKRLNEKTSALVRLIKEYPDLFKGNVVNDRLVIKILEQEVKAIGGVTLLRLHQFKQLTQLCKEARAYFRSSCLKRELFKDFLHHVAYAEEIEAKEILKIFPEFLLSDWRGNVTGCNLITEFLEVTAFELVVRQGDWLMWEMMLKIIKYLPEQEKKAYFTNLQQQFEILKNNQYRLRYRLDNLIGRGLRVLQGAPTEEQEGDVLARNAYHLIVEREEGGNLESKIIGCAVGFRVLDPDDPEKNKYQYRLHFVAPDSALHHFVSNPENNHFFYPKPPLWDEQYYLHRVLRDKEILELTRDEIHRFDGITQLEGKRSLDEEIQNLQTSFEGRMSIYASPSFNIHREYCCVIIGSDEYQLSAANLWKCFLGLKINLQNIESVDLSQLYQPRPWERRDADHRWVFPLSSSIGNDYIYFAFGVSGDLATDSMVNSSLDFLAGFCQMKNKQLSDLSQRLECRLANLVNSSATGWNPQ